MKAGEWTTPLLSVLLSEGWKVEATSGFEPLNRGFAALYDRTQRYNSKHTMRHSLDLDGTRRHPSSAVLLLSE